ncbi:MAG: MBL fold metallo-hydrolase [Armatimonadota bacterium]|nr:MBL fold metallo-hydrolase [Armatimonadota bacterium]
MTTTFVEEDLVWIRIPVPFPVGTVNSYLVRTDSGALLIDTGIHTPQALEALEEALDTAGVPLEDLRAIVLTHAHPDHVGLAGYIQQRTGAPIFLSERETEIARRVWMGPVEERLKTVAELYAAHGMPEALVQEVVQRSRRVASLVAPFGEVRALHEGKRFTWGGFEAHVYGVPGHSDGHIVLLDPRGRMFCGDHVLPTISPNIALYPGASENPLRDYLSSLHRVRNLPVRLALPGHGDPFVEWTDRVDWLLEHHARRLEAILQSLPPEGASAYEVARKVFGPDLRQEEAAFALSETLAHLEWLRTEGYVVRTTNHRVRYRPLRGLLELRFRPEG